jgi:hypothetical protein
MKSCYVHEKIVTQHSSLYIAQKHRQTIKEKTLLTCSCLLNLNISKENVVAEYHLNIYLSVAPHLISTCTKKDDPPLSEKTERNKQELKMILNYILIRHILTNSRKNSYTESCD